MKSLKNWSNGEPGGTPGIPDPLSGDLMSVVEDTLTTAGSSLAARSAKLSGAGRLIAGCDNKTAPPTGRVTNAAEATPARATDRNENTMAHCPRKRSPVQGELGGLNK